MPCYIGRKQRVQHESLQTILMGEKLKCCVFSDAFSVRQ